MTRSVKGPVTLEIRDAAGGLVQKQSSDAVPGGAPEAYFAKAWLKPETSLAKNAGVHQAVWNLRYARPEAIKYDFSIAAGAGATIVAPQGALALPGPYSVTLAADGVRREAGLRLIQDPRSASGDARQLGVSLSGRRQLRGAHDALEQLIEVARHLLRAFAWPDVQRFRRTLRLLQ